VTEQKQKLTHEGAYSSQVPASYHQNDEIDLRELFLTLWQGKWIVLASTFLLAIVATVYAVKQPSVYQVEAKATMNTSFYSMDGSYQLSLPTSLFNGSELIRVIKDEIDDKGSLLSGVGISYDNRNHVFTITKSSTSPEESYRGVELSLNSLNPILKQLELSKVTTAVNSVSSLEQLNPTESVKLSLSEIYAKQLYKKAVLENPDSQIVQVVTPPVKPTSHIKPKRPLIIVLGVLLGGMFGVAIVLIRFAFRKEQK